MNKEAVTEFDVIPLIKNRWSPRAFQDKEIEREKLQSIFEAARWAPSAFNEQPWRFITGIKSKGDTYERIADTLVEANARWATKAPVLVLTTTKLRFSHNNKENTASLYDLGQAVSMLTLQALHEGVYVHQMGGFSKEKAIENFDIYEVYAPVTVIAMGYLGTSANIPEDLQKGEESIRMRKRATEFVFENSFGGPSRIFKDID